MDNPDISFKKTSPLPWYEEGLHFRCTECGRCCTGSPGFVWVTDEEMKGIAATLDMPLAVFKRKYIRRRDNRYALIEKKTEEGDYDCIFLENKKCKIYQNRPKQCRTYPWWRENLTTRQSWQLAADECEGINDEAPLVSYSHIALNLELMDSN